MSTASFLRVTPDDITRIVTKLFLTDGDRRRNLSAFWVLLGLASLIAAAGVTADSTATVIGAIIVAPLMIPILGLAVALVLTDRRQIVACAGLVVIGAAVVVALGYALGLLVPVDVVAQTSDQVASRVQPRLIDLVAALATGMVGACAIVRNDVSDTLPGVAIAISLVPPLAVVRLTAEAGAWDQSAGALLLFATNVTAIVATGTALLTASGLRTAAGDAGRPVGSFRGRTAVAIAGVLLLVAAPLAYSSQRLAREQLALSAATPVVEEWAQGDGRVLQLDMQQGRLSVVLAGPPPHPDPEELRSALDAADLAEISLLVKLVDGSTRVLDADRG
jgi:uncharacterized hydrophobic protein (TIGR00271 family)